MRLSCSPPFANAAKLATEPQKMAPYLPQEVNPLDSSTSELYSSPGAAIILTMNRENHGYADVFARWMVIYML